MPALNAGALPTLRTQAPSTQPHLPDVRRSVAYDALWPMTLTPADASNGVHRTYAAAARPGSGQPPSRSAAST